jgi:uncharacterized protein (DUF1778 family)
MTIDTTRQSKAERLVARVSATQKKLFQRAADLQGRSLSDFVTSSLQEAAERVIREQESIVLGAADSRAFVEGLLNPPPVNARLRDTIRRYKERAPPADD